MGIHEIIEILEFQTQPIGNVISNHTSKSLRVYKFTNSRQFHKVVKNGQLLILFSPNVGFHLDSLWIFYSIYIQLAINCREIR